MRQATKATILAIAAACVSATASTVNAQMLAGSEWGPVEISGGPVQPVKDIFVQFDQDGRVFGNGGCNTFRGQFVTNDTAILFGPAATTMMACPEEIAKQETMFLSGLNAARRFERDGLDLTLSTAEGEVVMRLRQRDAD